MTGEFVHEPSDEQTAEPHDAFITLWAEVAVPSIRMVCVWAMWGDDEELQADVSAVVALETSRELCYSAAGKKPAGEAPDHAGMIALGWSYDGERHLSRGADRRPRKWLHHHAGRTRVRPTRRTLQAGRG